MKKLNIHRFIWVFLVELNLLTLGMDMSTRFGLLEIIKHNLTLFYNLSLHFWDGTQRCSYLWVNFGSILLKSVWSSCYVTLNLCITVQLVRWLDLRIKHEEKQQR